MAAISLAALIPALLLLAFAYSAASYSLDDVDFGEGDDILGVEADTTSMLQMSMQLTPSPEETAAPSTRRERELTMANVPFNFGHTVAKVAREKGIMWGDCGTRNSSPHTCLGRQTSAVTGCDLMYTPAKYWPNDLARAHFGNRTVFGILRDPYERLVAEFRGDGRERYPEFWASCDANAAVKQMMRDYVRSTKAGNPYENNCKLLPQAEFFDPPFGATIPVDNRLFPQSANELFTAHGYSDVQIKTEEVEHVSGCDNVWAGDLDSETKALVRQVYGRDFELLCKHFGYCNALENTCLTRVPEMCPPQLFSWDSNLKMFQQK